jgi:hypothetical protein
MRFDVTRSVLVSSFAVGIALLTACSGTEATSTTGVAGSWSTKGGAQTSINFQLVQTGSSLSGTGTIGMPPLAPISGPATPAYTGDNFTITSGSFDSPTVSFTATLGANPDGVGGFFRGTLSFSGTLSGGTMSGTVTFTPPRTASQTFAGQTVTGATLTKP